MCLISVVWLSNLWLHYTRGVAVCCCHKYGMLIYWKFIFSWRNEALRVAYIDAVETLKDGRVHTEFYSKLVKADILGKDKVNISFIIILVRSTILHIYAFPLIFLMVIILEVRETKQYSFLPSIVSIDSCKIFSFWNGLLEDLFMRKFSSLSKIVWKNCNISAFFKLDFSFSHKMINLPLGITTSYTNIHELPLWLSPNHVLRFFSQFS